MNKLSINYWVSTCLLSPKLKEKSNEKFKDEYLDEKWTFYRLAAAGRGRFIFATKSDEVRH